MQEIINIQAIINIVAIISGISGVVLGVYTIIKSRKEADKYEAETSQIYQGMLREEVKRREELENNVGKLKERVRTLEQEIQRINAYTKSIYAGAILLINQIESRGDNPIWKPEDVVTEYYEKR